MGRVTLDWIGKDNRRDVISGEYITQNVYLSERDAEWRNILFSGELESFIPMISKEYQGKFQTIYVDPPFFTGQKFLMKNQKKIAYDDRWVNGKEEYLSLLYSAFLLFHKILRDTGLLFVHIDYRSSAYVRLLLDEIFGEANFLNEIIWNYQSGGRAKKHFSRKHDTIYMYSKTKEYFFFPDAVGIPRGSKRRNHMKKGTDEDGRIYYSIRSAGKQYRYYEDEKIAPSDVWTDISHLQQKHPERTGYNTQKPEALLQRIILATSKEGDLIGDFFCGSGTTLATAEKLQRKWIGCDNSSIAIDICKERLLQIEDRSSFEVWKSKI